MKALIFASVSAIALTLAGTGVGYAAGADANGGTSSSTSSMSNGSNRMNRSGMQANADEVKEVQQKLKTAGLYQGQIDGIDGPETKQALQQFQKQNGLHQTGRLDHQTLAKLNIGEAGTGYGSSTPPQANPSGGASGTNSNAAGGSMHQ